MTQYTSIINLNFFNVAKATIVTFNMSRLVTVFMVCFTIVSAHGAL